MLSENQFSQLSRDTEIAFGYIKKPHLICKVLGCDRAIRGTSECGVQFCNKQYLF